MAKHRGGGEAILAGLFHGLKLSKEERSGVRGAWKETVDGEQAPQAVGKLFASKSANAEGLTQMLGKIWCPNAGIKCKEPGGGDLFLFTFLQPGGGTRAVMEGPWEFCGDLLIVADFDGGKRLRDLEFHHISVWVRVFDLPLGMMNRVTGMAIGNKLGKALLVESDETGSAIGGTFESRRIDIRKPLMRGTVL